MLVVVVIEGIVLSEGDADARSLVRVRGPVRPLDDDDAGMVGSGWLARSKADATIAGEDVPNAQVRSIQFF